MVSKNPLAGPAVRFVTDFTRLITDVDRLMVDLRSVSETEKPVNKPNGVAKKETLTGTISKLQDHARSFVESIQHFGNHLEHVPVPYLEFDRSGRILGTNQECAKMLNGTGTPLLGKSIFTFVSTADVKRLRENLIAIGQTNTSHAVPLTLVHKRRQFPVRLQVRPKLIGRQSGYAAMVENLAPSDLSQGMSGEALSAGRMSLQDLVLELSQAQTVKSVSDKIADYCATTFGSPWVVIYVASNGTLFVVSEKHSGRNIKRSDGEALVHTGPVMRVFQTGIPVFWRMEGKAHSVLRHVCRFLPRSECRHFNFLPIQAPGEQPMGVLAAVLPESEEYSRQVRHEMLRLGEVAAGFMGRVRAYEEALDDRVKAENAVRRKDEFLSILSHELKNPMMPILGWAVALSSGTLPADKQHFALDGIVRNVRALNYLIEDLFDAARMASGKFRLQPEETRIQEVAREALAAVQQTAESKKLRVSTDISEGIPPFSADPRRLRQVLMNLLSNAVKFTPGGGSISLKVIRRRHCVECIVSDTGKGIEAKFLPNVFDRFSQENRPFKVGMGGLGLGLSIVREIVELHGGSIRAASEGIDKGSTFILRLPMRPLRKNNRHHPK